MKQEVKDIISQKMKKKVLNWRTAEVFESLRECCDKNELHYANLSNKLSGRKPNITDFIYVKNIETINKECVSRTTGETFTIIFKYKRLNDFKIMALVDRHGIGKIQVDWASAETYLL